MLFGRFFASSHDARCRPAPSGAAWPGIRVREPSHHDHAVRLAQRGHLLHPGLEPRVLGHGGWPSPGLGASQGGIWRSTAALRVGRCHSLPDRRLVATPERESGRTMPAWARAAHPGLFYRGGAAIRPASRGARAGPKPLAPGFALKHLEGDRARAALGFTFPGRVSPWRHAGRASRGSARALRRGANALPARRRPPPRVVHGVRPFAASSAPRGAAHPARGASRPPRRAAAPRTRSAF